LSFERVEEVVKMREKRSICPEIVLEERETGRVSGSALCD